MNAVIATNRKAHRDYHILESFECGIELKGSEVKSLRQGKINLNDSFARVEGNEVILYNAHISPYEQASYFNVEPIRPRKLLLHKNQIKRLTAQLIQRGLTLIPLRAYFNARGFAKIELALCKGKKLYDKREALKRRETELAIRRVLKSRRNK
jgi:SsrA-binding protein